MIIEGLFKLISGVIDLIPFELPQMPGNFNEVLDKIFDYMLQGLTMVNIFIDLKFWVSCVVIVIAVKNIKKVWNSIIFLLNMIPSVNISYWN